MLSLVQFEAHMIKPYVIESAEARKVACTAKADGKEEGTSVDVGKLIGSAGAVRR